MIEPSGIPIVVAGPSGVGKGTVIQELLQIDDRLTLSISMTTRPPRPGEVEGQSYFFTTREKFEEAIAAHQLVEWAKVYHHYYGTPKSFLEANFAEARDVVLDIDIQGAAAVYNMFPRAIMIYLLPPTWEELKKRLYARHPGTGDDLDLRISKARHEIEYIGLFQYVVINDRVEEAAHIIHSILEANRHLLHRCTQQVAQICDVANA